MAKPSRILGIEMLRIYSMLMIVMLHVLGRGGILAAADSTTPHYLIAWTLESLAFPAVNAFGLISGYVGFGGRHRLGSAVLLCLMALTFDLFATLFALLMGTEMSRSQLFGSLFPPLIGRHWYLTSYLCIFPFMPLFDKLVSYLSEEKAKVLAVTILVLFCVVPSLVRKDFAGTRRGYSASWLAILYIVGGCIRKNKWFIRIKSIHGFFLYLVLSVTIVTLKIVLELLFPFAFDGTKTKNILFQYDSPIYLFGAIGLLLCFSCIQSIPRGTKLVHYLSRSSFAVFILHTVTPFYDGPLRDGFTWVLKIHPLLLVPTCLSACAVIYLVSVLIDNVRIVVFDKIKVNSLISFFNNERLRIIE